MKKLTKEQAKERALRYALSLVAFQEVGAGKDENLQTVRNVVENIRQLCKDETGIEISGYPFDFIQSNARAVIEFLPHSLLDFKKYIKDTENKIALYELEKEDY
jgi:hypothetical protein